MSRRREDEKGGKMNALATRAKLQILTAYICTLMTFFLIAVLVALALFINL